MSQFGRWQDICRDTGNRNPTIPVCNLFLEANTRDGTGFGTSDTCDLIGFALDDGRRFTNIGTVIVQAIAIFVCLYAIKVINGWVAAVGRRETQMFLAGYALVALFSIFSIGGFPLRDSIRMVFSALHIGAVVATAYMLAAKASVGFQIPGMDDGSLLSIAFVGLPALVFFVGGTYISLDTAFDYSGYFESTIGAPNKAMWLYVVYLIVTLLFVVLYACIEFAILCRPSMLPTFESDHKYSRSGFLMRVVYTVYEIKQLRLWLTIICFVGAQLLMFLASPHMCSGSNGKVNADFLQQILNLLAVIFSLAHWHSIIDEDYETPRETNQIGYQPNHDKTYHSAV